MSQLPKVGFQRNAMQYVLDIVGEVLDVVRIITANEVVQGTEGGGYVGLYLETIFRRKEENVETTLEDAENSLNYISG